jgi:hypothetical protein
LLQVNLLTSTANCGDCNNLCTGFPNAAPACDGGTCALGACNANYGNCNGNNTDGCEVSLPKAAVVAATAAAARSAKIRFQNDSRRQQYAEHQPYDNAHAK